MKSVFFILCMSLCSLHCAEQKDYCWGPQHMYAGARYTTPEGIGYHQGYTTLEGFFAPWNFLQNCWLPFLDVRGHVFDDGKFAANSGLGVRFLTAKRVWGMNVYYDYRNSSRQSFNQIGAGFEALGKIWDFRINGYFPVGEKQSHPFHSSAAFHGNVLLIRYYKTMDMKGVNAEVGAHVDCCKNAPFYFTAGAYYLTQENKTAAGGQLRARVDLLYRYLRIEGNTSYDSLFKWIGQAQVSINVPFGGRSKVANRSCSSIAPLLDRAIQKVDRFEIIAKTKRKKVARAINPETGQPWIFSE